VVERSQLSFPREDAGIERSRVERVEPDLGPPGHVACKLVSWTRRDDAMAKEKKRSGRSEVEGPESVEELLEEGQSFEAGIISGVEDAPDADQGGVRTRQVPEDDVPQEYLDDEIPGPG
jgi:hypothetical protein